MPPEAEFRENPGFDLFLSKNGDSPMILTCSPDETHSKSILIAQSSKQNSSVQLRASWKQGYRPSKSFNARPPFCMSVYVFIFFY